jgi:carbon-monoxide dehydrogenase large subunit
MSILGNAVRRKEDPRLLTSGGKYVDDLDIPGVVHVTYVRSTTAHALITGIDVDEARRQPGVLEVFTGADVDIAPVPPDIPVLGREGVSRPWLARDRVRYVGEAVAAIITEERYQGPDAAEYVVVDYEPLPVLLDPEEALHSEILVHPEAGTNVVLEVQGDQDETLFDGCEVVVRATLHNQRVAPAPIETRAGAAMWEADRLVHWSSCQGAHRVRGALMNAYGLDETSIRVIAPDVGGGFGAKGAASPEEVFLGWLSRRVGRPVKWTDYRSDSIVSWGFGRGQVQHVTIGGTRDGVVQAYRLEVVQNAGAYPRIGAMLPNMTRLMTTGVYNFPRAEFASKSVAPNTAPGISYRGAGRPEAAAAVERAMDLFADEIGIDEAEVRRRNFVPPDAFPFTTAVGTLYDSGDYERALDLVLAEAGYDDLRAEQRRRRESGDRHQLGIGLSTYVEVTNSVGMGEYAGITINDDASVVVRTGSSPHGQGHATAYAMIAADQLGIPIERITVIHGDTDTIPRGGGTGGSRSLQTGGLAVHEGSQRLVEHTKQLAADQLEAAVEDVVFDTGSGQFHVAGAPSVSLSWVDLAGKAGGALSEEFDFKPGGATFPFGAHVAVVEVDMETGRVTLERLVAVDDAGTVVNPLLFDGQVHGGLAQGVAQALFEEVVYDEDGMPLTSTLAEYCFPSAAELPSFETVRMVTPTPHNALGVKGVGEAGTIGATPAVQNAVVDALSYLGIRHLDMPASPQRVWSAIEAAGSVA